METFFRRRQEVDLDGMFRVMDRVAMFGVPEEWAENAGRNGADEEVQTATALALLRSTPKKFQALPRGEYPAFDGYPQFVIDYQAQLRERVARHERDEECKRQLVSTCVPVC